MSLAEAATHLLLLLKLNVYQAPFCVKLTIFGTCIWNFGILFCSFFGKCHSGKTYTCREKLEIIAAVFLFCHLWLWSCNVKSFPDSTDLKQDEQLHAA